MISAADRAAYGPLTLNFARRELTSRYKRSLLGWTWSVLNPLATVATYTLIFGVVFRAAPPETSNGRAEYFSLYIFTGLVVWTIFTGVVNGSMGWMSGISDMRKKVYFPAETAIFGGTIAIATQSLVEVAVLAVIMIALLNISPVFVLFPVVLALAALFGLGLGLVVAILNTLYRDVQYLVGIVLQLSFFLVPIIYPPEFLPDEAYGLPLKTLMAFHPMAPFIGSGHAIAYHQQLPSPGQIGGMLAWTVAALAFGLWYFRARSMRISEEL